MTGYWICPESPPAQLYNKREQTQFPQLLPLFDVYHLQLPLLVAMMVTGQLAGSLCRALLLASAAAAHHISSTPPNLTVQKSEPLQVISGQEEKAKTPNKCDMIHGPRLFNQIGMGLVGISPVCPSPCHTFQSACRSYVCF